MIGLAGRTHAPSQPPSPTTPPTPPPPPHTPADDQEHLWKAINPYDLLPKNKAYWHYTGSLTTPPCQLPTAGFNVQWYEGSPFSCLSVWLNMCVLPLLVSNLIIPFTLVCVGRSKPL